MDSWTIYNYFFLVRIWDDWVSFLALEHQPFIFKPWTQFSSLFLVQITFVIDSFHVERECDEALLQFPCTFFHLKVIVSTERLR